MVFIENMLSAFGNLSLGPSKLCLQNSVAYEG